MEKKDLDVEQSRTEQKVNIKVSTIGMKFDKEKE